MSETNLLLDPDKYEERLSQLAGPEGYTDDRMLEMDAAICALHAQLAAARDRSALLVEQLDEILHYEGGAACPLLDEYVTERANNLFSSLSAAAAGWREKVKKEGYDLGWSRAKAEIAAAIGCDWDLYLKAGDLWAVKLDQLLTNVKAAGAAEALRKLANGWHHHSGHETLPEVFPRPCQQGCTKCFILAEANKYEAEAAGRTGGTDEA